MIALTVSFNAVSNDPLFDDESNPCDTSYVTEYHQEGQIPLDKRNIIETWDEAKKIPTVDSVIEPKYITTGFELKFLYYKYHKVQAFYGLIGEEYDFDVICPRDYQTNGFVIVFGKDVSVLSELLPVHEQSKILDQLKPENSLITLTGMRDLFDGNAWEIYGHTSESAQISILVYNPNMILATEDKIFANSDGDFSTVITNGGPLFTSGTYIIIANQTGVESQITFDWIKKDIPVRQGI